MRLNIGAVPLTILGFALIGQAVAQEPRAGQPRAHAGGKATVAPAMQITAHTDDQITGVLTRGSLRVGFASRMETPSRAVLRLELGHLVLNAEADYQNETRTLDGHGHALTVEERMGLLALSAKLERYLNPYNRQLLGHEDLLFRVVSYWAEAPDSFPLKRRVISVPLPVPAIPEPLTQASSQTCSTGCEPEPPCFDDDSCCERCGFLFCGCDGEREFEFRYLEQGCACASYVLKHDYLGVHCYCSEILQAGCDLDRECLGRCFAGCGGSGGAGVYSYDCAEHDRCGRAHGCESSSDVACLDEFAEAGDDAFQPWNCAGCWCGNGVCDPGETCSNCSDCSCGSCQRCVGGSCQSNCGNGSCESNCGETCSNCSDCSCGSCQRCVGGSCRSNCGNGTCELSCGETCSTCPDDCGCGPCDQCISGTCVGNCGNGSCEPGCNEDCNNCAEDCGCSSCQRCVAGTCEDVCGNGTCEPSCGETCSTCPDDCGCGPCDQCISGTCVGNCGNGSCEAGCNEDCNNCAEDCGCSSCQRCVGGRCDPDCDDPDCPPCDGTFHPADQAPNCGCADSTCDDERIEACEAIAYVEGWKRGDHDDIANVVGALTLWKTGECYRWDEAQTNWVPDSCP